MSDPWSYEREEAVRRLQLEERHARRRRTAVRRRQLSALGAFASLGLGAVGVVGIVDSSSGKQPPAKVVHVVRVIAPKTETRSLTVMAKVPKTHHATPKTEGAAGQRISSSQGADGGGPTLAMQDGQLSGGGTTTSQSSTSGSGAGLVKPGAQQSFASFEQSQPGQIGIAVMALHGTQSVVFGDDEPAHGWSTTKVPVLAAVMKARGSSGLTAEEQEWADAAITESDNQSILDLFGDLETLEGGLTGASDYVQQLLRDSGDSETVVATAPPPAGAVTTFGQTEWAPSDAVKFYRAFANSCLLPSSDTDYVLNLMEHVISSESWGLGSADFGTTVAFKGGWGPEDDGYLVRQSGIVDPGSASGVAVSIVTHPPAGEDSFEEGTQMTTAAAQWLAGALLSGARSGATC